MKKYNRIFTIVIDSFGAGAMPDAAEYGDAGTDTMGHISESVDEFHIPNLQKLGIANLHPLKQVAPVERPMGYYSFLKEASTGKDTMTGHWEMMGLHITKPFKTFTETGFPKELIDELEKRTGHKVIGNKSASGTEILDELAEEEIATGHMIVYTSADSVLQICGNEETFGLDELYRCCEIARDITMKDEWKVGRVIARPYVGKKKGEFKRTSNRHDYALKPYGRTALNALKDAGYDVIGKTITIMGAGGAATAICAQAALDGVKKIHIFARETSRFWNRTQKLVENINATLPCQAILHENKDKEELAQAISESALLLNATSVGMAPDTEGSIIEDTSLYHPDLIVSDVIYNPRETRFLREAREAGCRTFNGMYMLLYQGAEAFRLWTGKKMPVEEIKAKYFSE